MPIITPKGLKGLQGIGSLSQQDYDAFVKKNDALISKHAYDPAYISNLYSNKMFIDRYGVDQFKAIPDFDMRNKLLREDVVNEEWDNLYGEMDDQWKMKYGMMSTDAKQKLLESDWLTPKEFDTEWKKKSDDLRGIIRDDKGNTSIDPFLNIGGLSQAMAVAEETGEAARQRATERNNRTLDNIYNDDIDDYAKALGDAVSNAYSQGDIMGMSDEQVKAAFVQAITPGSYEGNMGIPEYASHYGNGSDSDVTSEMEDFSVDDMRQVLAKKKVYEQYMSPDMAATALNNDAKRYIKEHQGSLKRFGLFAKDVGISAMSYTADKVNSIYNLGLMAADAVGDKPRVWVDDQGNIVDASTIVTEQNGQYTYGQGADGKLHPVHQMEIDRTTLHNMGKTEDGKDIGDLGLEWLTLNPQYWTRAEQFGTLDNDEQKQYEKLGSSPYKVAYNPNDDSDLMYESFKMMSFGLADGAAQLLPFGMGLLGKTLSTASKVGRLGRGLGQAMNWTGRHLTAQTGAGSLIQGLTGAGGIAYAYERGAFQETLAQNLANAEETALNRSKQEIYDQYQNDEQYKAQVDALIDARAASMKAEYMAQMGEQGQLVDEAKLDEMLRARAQQAVLGEMVQKKLTDLKGSDEYAALQNEAINSAGETATMTFLPEAIKYGLVNTVGFRKWFYTNPTGLKNKVAAGLQGLREVTTPAGRQRLATETSKFLTNGQKWKQMGKIAGSQIWGGAWTNGTDDMMVDAAERINADSFDRYLNAFENGESMADTYGFADGLYSYWKGLNNSLGQETTWNAATVGGLGSILSFTPNMTNIVHYFTKEGRQAYKNNFQQRAKRNEDGSVMRDEQGNVQYEDVSLRENWRDRFNYFIQNGVLNTYYGAKQNERDLQNHADYVNNLLDDYDDFKVIEDLVTSDIALDNAETVGEQKTMRFVKAINAVNALNQLAQNQNDPTTLSSVIQNTKDFIAKAANMQMEGENAFTEEEVNNMLAQYYANNPGVVQSEANNQLALYQISQNAQKLQEASEAYDKAEQEVQKIERNLGKRIDPAVRAKMKMNQALNPHWRERVQKMQDELDDTADITGDVSQENLIPSVGGRKSAEALIKVYDKQQDELQKELEEQKQKTQDLKDKLDEAVANRKAAKTSEEKYNTQKAQEEAQAKYDDAVQQEAYLRDLGTRTTEKKNKVIEALNNQAQDESGKYQEKVLTADEIFGLDPVTRARMLNPENRQLYSDAQQREISKLEQRLLMRDGDALSKIQDIARLSQRIAANEDAYSRMAQNPEAAAVALEAQRAQEADTAYKLINQRNAETVADFINQFEEGMKGHDDVSQDQKNEFVFRALRKMSPTLLDIIENDSMLPQYQQQVQDAKEWGNTVADVKAVIDNAEESQQWKDNVMRNVEQVVENANNRDDIMTNLEKVIDDVQNPQVAQDFEKVLNGLEQLGYQRDATVIESRKQRKEREAAEAQRKKEAEEDAKIAAAEAQAKAQEAANAQPAQEVAPDGSNLQAPWDVAPIDQSEETAEQRGELSEELDLNKPIVTKPSYHSSMKSQIGEKKSNWDYYTESDKETRQTKEGKVILGIAMQGTLQPAINYAVDAGVLDKGYKLSDAIPSMENSTKVREATKALKDLGINTPQQLIEFVEQNDGKNLEDNKKADSSVNNNVEASHIIDNGESVQGKSATINEQMSEANEGKEVHSSEETTDYAAQNGTGEHVIETSATSLSGNAMSEYKSASLQNEGKLEHKKGENPTDSMSRYFAWMDAAGIKLQNIIDEELGLILKQNPHAKVKFMVVRPDRNATNDVDMKTHLLLVLDYDNKVNKGITNIHNDENGGVLESNGKKYLVIGTVGYGNRNADKLALYDILFSNNPRSTNGYGLVKRGQGEFFRTHPEERFYVPENLSTEVVPQSLIPGYIVKQLETDGNPEFRSIRDLLTDKERNPQGLEMQDLAWGIQERTQFLVVGTNLANVMIPRNPDANSGSAFVLISASNGKMVPSYLKPLFYNEMMDGALKDRVEELLGNVTSPNYATRLQAVIDLSNIFYMDKEGDTILLMKSKNVVSLVHDGKTFKTFVLDENFDRQAFMEAMVEMNPRVNITKSVLQSNVLLQQYDEAGALLTDIARMTTAGSSYSVYGLDAQGQMLKPEVVNNDIPRTGSNSDFRNGDRTQVVFKHQYYNYDRNEGRYYLNGIPVTDETMVRSLDYNRRVIKGGIAPVESSGVWNTYILGSKEHPEAVKIHRNTKEVKEVSDAEALQLIEKIEKENAERERAEAAKAALEATKVEDVDILGEEEGMVVDDETGELITPDELRQRQEARLSEKEKKEGEEEAPAQPQRQEDKLHKSGAQLESSGSQGATQNFNTLAKSRQWRKQVSLTLKQKWPETSKMSMEELKQFLKGKNVEVDAIETSDTAVLAWIDTIINCR